MNPTITLTAGGRSVVVDGSMPVDGMSLRSWSMGTARRRLVSTPRPNGDGQINTSRLWDSRTMHVAATARRDDIELVQLFRGIAASERVVVEIEGAPGYPPIRAEVVPLELPISTDYGEYATGETSHEMVADIPAGVWHGVEQHRVMIRPIETINDDGIEFGPTLDEFDGIEFPLVESSNATPVTNAGTTAALPVLRVFGPFGVEDDPGDRTVIANVTTGQQLVIEGTYIAAGDYLELDAARRTIRVNGLAAQSRRDRLVFPESDWWALVPGVNEIEFRPDTWSGNCALNMVWRDTFL